MSECGCTCVCHKDEKDQRWPGPCAGCCEPGDNCDCGRALSYLSDPWEDDPDYDDGDLDYDDGYLDYLDDLYGEEDAELWPDADDADIFVDEHAVRRDAKRAKITGMQVSGRSIKSVLVPVIEKRGRDARRKGDRRAS